MKKDRRTFLLPLKNKEKKQKTPWTKKKKIVVFSSVSAAVCCVIAVCLCLYFFVFNKKTQYFNFFNSVDSIDNAELLIGLPEGCEVWSYDVNSDVFVISEALSEGTSLQSVTLYGIASADEVYVEPRFTSVESIRGDFAIVTMTTASGFDSDVYYIGLVRFRGEGTLDENGKRKLLFLTDFSLVHNSASYNQMYFCGEYVCMLGCLENPSITASYSTFYDYKSHNRMLEAFRVRYGYDETTGKDYTMTQVDDYLAVYSDSAAYFFNIKSDCYQGYLERIDSASYSPFSTLTDNSMTGLEKNLNLYYMGNGWFMCYACLTSQNHFDGQNLGYFSMDENGNNVYVFARTKVDFYNVKTGASKQITQLTGIVDVANRYTNEAFAAVANEYNGQTFLQEDGHITYENPCINPAAIIRDDCSIVYYYYRPHIEEYRLDPEKVQYATMGEMTYCILDKNMMVVTIDSLYPVLFVDGVGYETADPTFDPLQGDVAIYDKEMAVRTLVKSDARYKYTVVGANSTAVVIACVDGEKAKEKTDETEGDEDPTLPIKYGAVTPDGKIIVDCLYDELTPFYGGYALGYRDKKTFRIDKFGSETELNDVYAVKDGVYIFTENEKFGLKNYEGKVLLDCKYDLISVSDNYLVRGQYQQSYAVAQKDGRTYIYKLGEK